MTVLWLGVTTCCLACCLILANRVSTPKEVATALLGKRRLWIGDVVSILVVALFYPLLLLTINRFWSATLLGFALIVLLWAGNRLKVMILSETLVFSDVFLAGHALRYPRLYFGYAPTWIWPCLIGLLGLGVWGMSHETAFSSFSGLERTLIVASLISMVLCIGWILSKPFKFIKGCLVRWPLSFDAQTDVWAYTPLGAGLLHLLWHGQYRKALRDKFSRPKEAETDCPKNGPMPKHLLLIQAESYVPLHQWVDRRSVTPTLDGLMKTVNTGSLELAWRGAYTMRTEFAVLTGIAPRQLETYGFDPYRLAAMVPMQSLAWTKKREGYKAVVCHPNDGHFFNRFQVMKNLGFDEFIDLKRLITEWPELKEERSHCGRYINDQALLEWASNYLKNASEPTFLFLITMEAHGPWDESKFPGAQNMAEEKRYEVHLGHLDLGVETLLKAQEEGLDASILIYGDHPPGLRILREKDDILSSQTTWVAWNTKNPKVSKKQYEPLGPEKLTKVWQRILSSFRGN